MLNKVYKIQAEKSFIDSFYKEKSINNTYDFNPGALVYIADVDLSSSSSALSKLPAASVIAAKRTTTSASLNKKFKSIVFTSPSIKE